MPKKTAKKLSLRETEGASAPIGEFVSDQRETTPEEEAAYQAEKVKEDVQDTIEEAVEIVETDEERELRETLEEFGMAEQYKEVKGTGSVPQVGPTQLLPPFQQIDETDMGGWIQTYTGRKFYPLEPDYHNVDIEDITHALSCQCRFSGHTKHFYSVAEHSVLMAEYAYNHTDVDPLKCLLHDAAEAYLVDFPRPLKQKFPDFGKYEDLLLDAIFTRLNLTQGIEAEVAELDNRILFTEKRDALTDPNVPWPFYHEPLNVTLQFWSPRQAEEQFREMYNRLTK